MSPEIFQLIVSSTFDTLIMVGLSGLLGTLFGLPLGVFLATSRAGELFSAPMTNRILGLIVNATRSTPFIILVVAIVPLTRLIVGTSIGTRAAVVPLTIAAIPFIGRVVEAAIREVDQGLVEAARAFCASWSACWVIRRWWGRSAAVASAISGFATDTSASCRR
jgi:D-methionine transport system permease protein